MHDSPILVQSVTLNYASSVALNPKRSGSKWPQDVGRSLQLGPVLRVRLAHFPHAQPTVAQRVGWLGHHPNCWLALSIPHVDFVSVPELRGGSLFGHNLRVAGTTSGALEFRVGFVLGRQLETHDTRRVLERAALKTPRHVLQSAARHLWHVLCGGPIPEARDVERNGDVGGVMAV